MNSSSSTSPPASNTKESPPAESSTPVLAPDNNNNNNNHTNTNDPDDEWLLSCRCASAHWLASLLACLCHVDSRKHALQPVTVFCSPTNLTFHVYGKAQQMQASVDVPASLLEDYHVLAQDNEEKDDTATASTAHDWQAGGEFSVNLTTLLECLQLLGKSNTSNLSSSSNAETSSKQQHQQQLHHSNLKSPQLAFSYNLTQQVFSLELLLDETLCRAVLPGLEDTDNGTLNTTSLATRFQDAPVQARVIVQSEILRTVATELVLVPGATVATVSVSHSQLQVAVVGHWGECCVSIPAHGSHVVAWQVETTGTSSTLPITYNYPLASLLASWKGLPVAHETCWTINAHGLMAMQHQIIQSSGNNGGDPSFVDFILSSLQDPDPEDHEDDDTATVATQPYESYAASSPDTTRKSYATSSPPPRDYPRDDDSSHADASSVLRSPDRASQTEASLSHSRSRSSKSSWWGAEDPPSRSRGNDSTQNNHDNNDSDDDSSDHDTSARQQTSVASLFGAVAVQPNSSSSGTTLQQHRRQRQRWKDNRVESSAKDNNNDDSDEASVDLLAQDDEEDETQLDITAPASPQSRRSYYSRGSSNGSKNNHHPNDQDDDGSCSSPEVVYGR